MTSVATDRIPRLALTVGEAAEALGVSEDFFHQHIDPDLRWIRIGRKKLVRPDELRRWLVAHEAVVLGEDDRTSERGQ